MAISTVDHDDCFVAIEGGLFEVVVIKITRTEWLAAILIADGIMNAALEHSASVVMAEVAKT